MSTSLPPKPPYNPGPQQPAWTGPPTNASPGGGAVVVMVVVIGIVILLGLACGGAALGFLFFARAAQPVPTVEEWAHAEAVPVEVQPIEGSLDLTPTDPARAVWSYPVSPEGASGSLKQQDAGNWLETRSDGLIYNFTEVARTNEHVELFDESRQLYVRLYDDRMEWRRSGEWLRGQNGGWQPAAVESPQP